MGGEERRRCNANITVPQRTYTTRLKLANVCIPSFAGGVL